MIRKIIIVVLTLAAAFTAVTAAIVSFESHLTIGDPADWPFQIDAGRGRMHVTLQLRPESPIPRHVINITTASYGSVNWVRYSTYYY